MARPFWWIAFSNADYNNFGPRASFAWDPTRKGRMSVRGGMGIFYDPAASQLYGGSHFNPPIWAIVTADKTTPPFLPLFGLGKSDRSVPVPAAVKHHGRRGFAEWPEVRSGRRDVGRPEHADRLLDQLLLRPPVQPPRRLGGGRQLCRLGRPQTVCEVRRQPREWRPVRRNVESPQSELRQHRLRALAVHVVLRGRQRCR